MISKLVGVIFFALAYAQVPEQYPAGVDPAKCPNFPICDNAALHNSQAVPRTLPLPPQHYQQPQQQQYVPVPQPQQQKPQWVGVEHQRSSVPVSHRNTALPSYNPPPPPPPSVQHSIPRPVQPSYPVHQSLSHDSSSQWTLKNLQFDSDDFSTNYLSEPVAHKQQPQHQYQQPRHYEPQPQQYQHQQQYQPQPQYQPQQHQYTAPQQQHYATKPNHHSQPQKGGDKYPAGVDAKACPNYPYCGSNGLPHPAAHKPVAPLPGFTERLYPAGVSPQECANFPYCFE
ncbi:DNA translocase FtsK-like [Condylostylus longicornis]|uniref:DNA translocase FtsK-like n=1 Tax=Condylostylus longicornis TaxID=2530218 RepID=UPI00244E1435|nr:DNA translocase FtsK-like [Condylostylus longicornis]